jgi:O-antigen/teichoic acid export membrane protein
VTGRKIAIAVSASWFSQAIRIALNLLVLPVMFRFMGQEELGIWLVLGQSTVLFGFLTEAGLTPTLTRRIAFVAGKSRTGLDEPLDEDARRELATLMASGAMTYRMASIGIFVIAFALGSLYLHSLDLQHLSPATVWTAWVVLCVGYATSTWSGLWLAVANGLGYVATATLVSTAIGVGTLLAQVTVILAGGGLVWLAIVSALAGIASRFVLRLYIRLRQPDLLLLRGRFDRPLVRDLLGLSGRAWLTALGDLLLFKTDQYFIAFYLDAKTVPAYYVAYTIFHNLAILALALGQASSVYVSRLWQAGALREVHEIVLRGLRITLILTACGVATLLAVGADVIGVWVGPEHFVGYPVLAALGAMFLLCVQQNAVLTFSRATENEVYAIPFLIAGGLNLILSWILVQSMGVVGVALATLLAQLLTTNWIVLRDGLRRLKLSVATYVRTCGLPSLAVLLTALFATIGAVQDQSLLPTPLSRILVATAVSGAVCVGALWLFGLSAAGRGEVRRRLRAVLRPRLDQPASTKPPVL